MFKIFALFLITLCAHADEQKAKKDELALCKTATAAGTLLSFGVHIPSLQLVLNSALKTPKQEPHFVLRNPHEHEIKKPVFDPFFAADPVTGALYQQPKAEDFATQPFNVPTYAAPKEGLELLKGDTPESVAAGNPKKDLKLTKYGTPTVGWISIGWRGEF